MYRCLLTCFRSPDVWWCGVLMLLVYASAASLGGAPWYVKQCEVLLVLLGAQAWGLAPTPPQSPELAKARTGGWGYMSIQAAMLLAYPLLHPLVAATTHRAGGLLRRWGGLVGLCLGLCLSPVLLQAAYPHATTTLHRYPP